MYTQIVVTEAYHFGPLQTNCSKELLSPRKYLFLKYPFFNVSCVISKGKLFQSSSYSLLDLSSITYSCIHLLTTQRIL